jgi:DNA-directed RNA polymerase subunit omega
MNSELTHQAALRVGDPNVLINLVSRRVRQLSNPGTPGSRPLLTETATMGSADIALSEIIHDKMGWEVPEPPRPVEQAAKKKSRKHH